MLCIHSGGFSVVSLSGSLRLWYSLSKETLLVLASVEVGTRYICVPINLSHDNVREAGGDLALITEVGG